MWPGAAARGSGVMAAGRALATDRLKRLAHLRGRAVELSSQRGHECARLRSEAAGKGRAKLAMSRLQRPLGGIGGHVEPLGQRARHPGAVLGHPLLAHAAQSLLDLRGANAVEVLGERSCEL